MNDQRRKEIAKAIALLKDAYEIVNECASGERDYFDNMPESLQSSDKGQNAEEAADTLDEVVSNIECAIEDIESIVE